MSFNVPNGPGAITTDWLTFVLRESGTLVHANVTSIQVAPLGRGNGQLVRLTVEYDCEETTAPHTLIAKFPAANPMTRSLWTQLGFYENEVRFYQHLAETSELRTPRCYHCTIDDHSGNSVLLLEDLAPARDSWLNMDCSLEDAALAVCEIAKLHARWWERIETAGLHWLSSLDAEHYRKLQGQLQEQWEPFVVKLGDVMPPKLLAVGDALRKKLAETVSQLGTQPRTLIHYDFHVGNMLFAAAEGKVPFAVVDWEFMRQGRGTPDLARFVGLNLPIDRRRSEEQAILEIYHATLVDHGVQRYSYDQCFDDYRLSMLDCLTRSFIMAGALDAHDLRTMKVTRYGTAALDLNADEFIQ